MRNWISYNLVKDLDESDDLVTLNNKEFLRSLIGELKAQFDNITKEPNIEDILEFNFLILSLVNYLNEDPNEFINKLKLSLEEDKLYLKHKAQIKTQEKELEIKPIIEILRKYSIYNKPTIPKVEAEIIEEYTKKDFIESDALEKNIIKHPRLLDEYEVVEDPSQEEIANIHKNYPDNSSFKNQ